MKNDIYSAFSNQVRVKLLLCLDEKPKTVTELVSNCGLSQSAISQHLHKLKQSGLITNIKKGHFVTYSLKYKQAVKISRMLSDLNREINP